MDNRSRWLQLLTVLVACFSSLLSYAQPSVKTFADKSEILIGEQLKLRVQADFAADAYKVRWLSVPDSLPHFEVVNRSKIDSVYTNNQLSGITQTFTLTSFDSGKWTLPSFMVGVDPVKGDTTYNFFTDSVPVTVSFSVSDTTTQLRDIKPIREVETINTLWYWIAGGALLVALIIFLIWLYSRKKKTVVSPIPVKSNLSAYDEAMAELKKLQQHDFSNASDTKIVHTKLAEILKRYLSRRENDNYLNKTTSDILLVLTEIGVNKTMLSNTAGALRSGDAVKFAKYVPPAEETTNSISAITELIQSFKQNTIPPSVSKGEL
ncbi:MAG: DUF4381 family protein [Ferruginibacter sp.]